MATIVESRRSGIRVAGEVLDVFKWNPLCQKIRDYCNPNGMG